MWEVQISFDVKGGEIFGFLGPDGAVKTTLIRMLTTGSQAHKRKCQGGLL
ncbi:MAG: ATP-binding cassette domain-containing protein [bacterium]